MTEQEFQQQVWRSYDKITTADGIPGKVLGLNFLTKSVRAYISGSPEWVKCELIETHTSANGNGCDDASIIEELHNKVTSQRDEIDRLRKEKAQLAEKVGMNRLNDVMRAVQMLREALTEKKTKIAKLDAGLQQLEDTLNKIETASPQTPLP